MATYKYTQDFWTDDPIEHPAHEEGYVNYNISPDFGPNNYVTSETPITMQFEVMNSHFASKSFSITVTDGTQSSFITVDIDIPKNTVKRFTINKIYLRDISDWSDDRIFYVTPYFTFHYNTGGGQGEFTTWNTPEIRNQQKITFLKYDIKPTIDSIVFNRYDQGEEPNSYIVNDEGQYVFGSFKISLASGYNANNISIATVQVSDGTNNIFSKDLTEIDGFLSAALSQTGYIENKPDLFTVEVEPATDPPTYEPVLFDSSIDYTITFTIGDNYSIATSSIELSRAFANIHLSGQRTGGVAFGRFSSSKENDPKFENEYPAYLYGGISEVGNVLGSLAALGVQMGTVSASAVSDNSSDSTVIPFKRKYSSPPTVICCIKDPQTTNTHYAGSCSVAVGSVDNDKFTLYKTNRSGHSVSFGANWIAIGQPNTDPNSWGVVTLARPSSAMTSNNSQNCIASASSEYSSKYKAYQAFSSSREKGWASLSSDQNPWIQLEMDVALKNIVVSVYSRDNSSVYNPTDGEILGSNDGVTFVSIGTFSGWSSSAKNALLGTVECDNSSDAYQYVKILITGKTSSSHYAAIGHITIEGDYEAPSGE